MYPKVVKVKHITDGLWCMGACGTDFHNKTASHLKEMLADLGKKLLGLLTTVIISSVYWKEKFLQQLTEKVWEG